MFFRNTFIIKPLHLAKDDHLTFTVTDDERTVVIEIQKIPAEQRQKGYGDNDLRISATIEIELSGKRKVQFLDLKSPLSNSVQEFIRPFGLFLYETVIRFIKTFRWRLRNENGVNPIRSGGGFAYSPDGKEWKPLPDQVRLILQWSLPVPQQYSPKDLIDVQDLVSVNIPEPVGHELLQEAWELRRTATRSALVIGLAAAETGFKQFSSAQIPTASWLIENVPSPPLTKMLQNFLPQIPTKLSIYGRVLAPPDEMIKIINKGVTIRNEIVHGKKATVSSETVEEILNAIRDLLYLLDYYDGHLWAWAHINPIHLNSLIASAKPDKEASQ